MKIADITKYNELQKARNLYIIEFSFNVHNKLIIELIFLY